MHRMKQLKSTSQDLRDLFERNILVRHVAEDLQSCKAGESAVSVRGRMEESDFDVLGIDDDGVITQFVLFSHCVKSVPNF